MEYRQLTPYYCGPACISILAQITGKGNPDQTAIAKSIGTTPDGTGIYGLKKGLREMGVDFTPHKGKLSISKVKSDWAIVWDRTRDHWMVAHRYNGYWWKIFDPEPGTEYHQCPEEFEKSHFSKWNSYAIFLEF